MKRNIFILLIAVSILFVFSTSVFASETIDVKDYIKGKFPIMFNIYLASLEGLDQYEKEFIDLLQNLPEEEQKNFAKEVYNNGFSKEILAKIKDALLLNVPLFLEGAVGEKLPEKSFTWDEREGAIIITAGNRVKGWVEFVKELRKVLHVSGWGSRSLLDFTENERDLERMRNSHTVFMIRPENLEELEKLEAKHPDLLPLSCSKLKSYSFPLLYFSRDDNKKIRGVIITDGVTPLLAKSLTEDALLLNVPLFLEGAVGEKLPEKSFTWDEREGAIIITAVKTANIEISFDPDPVHCENDCLDWRVIISETKGVGVNLKTIVADVYVGDNYIGNDFTINEAEMNEVWGTPYLSAFSSMDDFNCRWCPCEGNTGITIKYKVTGIDDNGRQVEATADLELMD